MKSSRGPGGLCSHHQSPLLWIGTGPELLTDLQIARGGRSPEALGPRCGSVGGALDKQPGYLSTVGDGQENSPLNPSMSPSLARAPRTEDVSGCLFESPYDLFHVLTPWSAGSTCPSLASGLLSTLSAQLAGVSLLQFQLPFGKAWCPGNSVLFTLPFERRGSSSH